MPKLNEPWHIFKMINSVPYIKSGDDVDWSIQVDEANKYVWLIFQASEGNLHDRDWKNNFRFPAKLYKKQESCMLIHRGYGDAWKSCNDEVMTAFIKICNEHPDYLPMVCGWSYGGAMALLGAEDFCYRTKRRAGVVTFGAPKPLWGRKTKKYFWGCVRFAFEWSHVNDVVPLLPPLPGYCGLGTSKCGSGFNLLKLFKPEIYHCSYGDESLYK